MQDLLRVHVRHALHNLKRCVQYNIQSGFSTQGDITIRPALLQEDSFRHGALQVIADSEGRPMKGFT